MNSDILNFIRRSGLLQSQHHTYRLSRRCRRESSAAPPASNLAMGGSMAWRRNYSDHASLAPRPQDVRDRGLNVLVPPVTHDWTTRSMHGICDLQQRAQPRFLPKVPDVSCTLSLNINNVGRKFARGNCSDCLPHCVSLSHGRGLTFVQGE